MRADRLAAGLALVTAALPASAHHGVAGLGAASLEGPGAPIEQSSSATLPEGKIFTYFNASFALGVKLPAGTDLNEDDEQQGAEGNEDYRVILSMSALF